MVDVRSPWTEVAKLLRAQRQLAELSLRSVAKMAHVSDSYLSQVERGLYEPSPEVLKSIATALKIPVNGLYERLGWLDDLPHPPTPEPTSSGSETSESAMSEPPASASAVCRVEDAIASDPGLSPAQKRLLVDVYRNFLRTA